MLIDTHFHLDLMDNMTSLITEFRNTDVGIIAVGTTPKAYKREVQFTEGVDNIHVGLGMHPQLVDERENEIDLFLELMDQTRYIGEIGIDLNNNYVGSKEKQIACFRKIVKACAASGNQVLSIHGVKASSVVVDELNAAGTFKNNICIFHWFTGTKAERKKAVESGAWFSVNSRMLKTKNGKETILGIPIDRMLLETDAPFTTKFSSAGDLKIELKRILIGISELRGTDVTEQIEENSQRLFEHHR